MTSKKEPEIKSEYELTRFIRTIIDAKIYILVFAFIGLISGYLLKPKNVETEYLAKGEIQSLSSNAQVISNLLLSLNQMDPYTRAEKLNISRQVSSKFIKITTNIIKTIKSPDIPNYKEVVTFDLIFTNKQNYNLLTQGITQYISSDEFIKTEYIKYLSRRKIRSEILNYLNVELDKLNTSKNYYNAIENYNKQSTADLLRLKLEIEYDSLNSPTIIQNTFKGIPEIAVTRKINPSFPIIFSIFGALLGFMIYWLIQNDLFRSELKLILKNNKKNEKTT